MLRAITSRLLVNSRSAVMTTRTLCAGIEGSDGFPSNLQIPPVVHDVEKSRFYIKLDDQHEAVLSYEKKKNLIDMYDTEVPMDWQGKGIAGQLAKTALGYAVANNIPMRLTCTYLQNFYKDNPKPEYERLYVATLESLVVKHDKKLNKFFIKLDEESEAVLLYEMNDGVMDMYETLVPEKHQGRGFAGVLAKAAFDYAVDNRIPFKLSCTYLQDYYKQNSGDKYKRLVVAS